MTASGFALPDSVLATLSSSKAFQILRTHITSDPANQPCALHPHPDASTIASVSTLHLLLQPIARLHETCTQLAHAALCRPSPSELELAFRNEARSAFLWLTCFLDDEESDAWMATEGCPTCVIEQVLSSDSTVRMALTASLVAKARVEDMDLCDDMPSLDFFLTVLHNALDKDTFWGPGYFAELMPKAEQLCVGIQAMAVQAAELEILVSSPSPSPTASRCEIPPLPIVGAGSIALSVSPMAKRQQTLRREEEAQILSLRRLAWQCNAAGASSRVHRLQLRDASDLPRKRSLTWQP